MTFQGPLEHTVEIVRLLDASPKEVFGAWTNVQCVKEWYCVEGTTLTEAEFDLRPGGNYRLVMSDSQGDYEIKGEYVQIIPGERLVFTWLSSLLNWESTLVDIEFKLVDGKTELILTHEKIPPHKLALGHQGGWDSIIVKFTQLLAA